MESKIMGEDCIDKKNKRKRKEKREKWRENKQVNKQTKSILGVR